MTALGRMGRRAAGLAAGLLLAGCLPKSSLARRDEVEADVYALAMDVAVRTEGLDVPPFTWHLEGTVGWSFTRAFRDGSLGHLLRVSNLSSTTARDGLPPAPTPTPLEGAFVELRAFPDGQLLAVSGASPWMGNPAHLEVLDVLGPLLSPHLPGTRAEAAAFTTSWPTRVEGGPWVRNGLEAAWTNAGDVWTYAGTLAGHGGYVDVAGRAAGTVTLGEGSTRVLAHTFDWDRAVTTTWHGGKRVVQAQRVTGALRRVGAEPAPLLDMPVTADDASADARALHLRDGRRVEERPVDLTGTLPFLLLPDDLTPDERARVGAALAGAGSM